MGKLRLRDWKDIAQSAGVYALAAVLLGSLLLFAIVYSASRVQQPGSAAGECVLTSRQAFEKAISRGEKAIMFSSDTCPVCKRMEPYWRELCSEEPGKYYILKLNSDTYNVFMEYGVLETPTFIVFRNGTPIARHVGGFTAPHGQSIADVMKAWASASMSGAGAGEGLQLLNKYCSSCHPVPQSVSPAAIGAWIHGNASDPFVQRFAQAYISGVTMSQLYNGTSNLIGLIMSMNRSVSEKDAEEIALFLDNLAVNRTGPSSPTSKVENTTENNTAASQEQGLAAMSAAAALTAGIIAAFSPCVFPLLLSYTAMLQARGQGASLGLGAALRSGLAAAAGVAAVGMLFVALGSVAQRISSILVPAAAATLFAAGILGAMDVPTFVNIGMRSRRGLTGFSFIYGLLAVQCSFPLVAGTFMLLTAGASMRTAGLLVLAAFTLGVSVPVAVAVYASGRQGLRRALSRLSSKGTLRYANALLAVMGLVMLAYSLGLV